VFKELLYAKLTELTLEVNEKKTMEETWEARNVAEGFRKAIDVAERISSREELKNVERESGSLGKGLRRRGRFPGRDRNSASEDTSGGGLRKHPYGGISSGDTD
jgi:hypothetical protein